MALSVAFTVFGGMLVSENRGGTERQYVRDPLGSLVAEIDATEGETYKASYWPYGEVASESGSRQSDWGFVGLLGYLRDLASLLYVRARHYFTSMARWLTVDPMWPSENAFHYGQLDPTSHVDPSGLISATCYDLIKKVKIPEKDRAKYVKCVLDCIEGGGSPIRCGAKCLLKLGKGIGKRELLQYLCCIVFSRRIEVDKGQKYYIDPCETKEDINCCHSRFCACLLDRPGQWEGIADGMCPGKVVLKCQAAAEEDCEYTGYVSPNI